MRILIFILFLPQLMFSDIVDSLFLNDAKCVAQGLTKDGFFEDTLIHNIAEILEKLHKKYPEISDIHPRGGVYNSLNPIIINEPNNPFKYRHLSENFTLVDLNVSLNANATRQIMKISSIDTVYNFSRFKIDSTGIKNIDILNKKYGSTKISVWIPSDLSRSSLHIKFRQKLDIIRLIEIYTALPEVTSATAEHYIGCNASEIYLIIKENNWHFVFKKGWGETGFGCRHNQFHYFTYNLDSFTFQKNDELYFDNFKENIKLWHFGIPKIRMVYPFTDYENLIQTAKSEIWWEKLYAIDVIGYLMLPDFVRYNVDDEILVDEIRDKIINNKKDLLRLLISNLNISDNDISKTAYTYLLLISGKKYSLNDSGNWLNWVNQYQ